ncbi:MAG: hypothetical protein CSA09_02120 [Candidatus Contendobacter odensis]|uniref:Uncharacterized protein n=1 Tax=Candidatus Contendibacter odensensis TaxID=1400860 RepID=A0A2G6PGC1_9GAMM|nr:MAG: hypothetical protein CSA09_02120 [Candidatus Contendobacter odensis]
MPEHCPHAGYRPRQARNEIRAGGWYGDIWHNTVNGRVMTVPAVERDFAATFFLNRYGRRAGLILAGLQALFILLLMKIADCAWLWAEDSDQQCDAWSRFIGFGV